MSALEKVDAIFKTPENELVKEWRAQGKKVIGYYCSYIPEELIYAADMLPYRVRPEGCVETPYANVYMTEVHCTFVRASLEYLLDGTYEFFDGLVGMNSCDAMRRVFDVYKEGEKKSGRTYPFLHFVDVPYKVEELSINHFATEELARFKKALEQFSGVEITDKKLKEAIDVYNETRSLLKEMYDLRKGEKPLISGAEALKIVSAATSVPKVEYNKLLREVLAEVKQREGISGYRARLMLIGSALDSPEYVELMEEAGGLVVTDDLCFGSRYFWAPVKVSGDLLYSLADSYVRRPACARMVKSYDSKRAYLEGMIKDFKVDGVVHERIRYCDLWGSEIIYIKKKLDEIDVPLISIEREYWPTGMEQLRTRIQAFLETIEARGPREAARK